MNRLKFTCIQLFLGIGIVGNAQTTVVYNKSGNFIVPAGVGSVTVQAWGAGAPVNNNVTGGGGGAYVLSKPIPVTPGTSIAVTVGVNGAGSSFGTFITANGTTGSSGGAASTGTYVQNSFKGGNGGTGNTFNENEKPEFGGGGGAGAGPLGAGPNGLNATQNAAGAGANGAVSGGGSGGNGGSLAASGAVGNAPGGGGGGMGSSLPGDGRVIITYSCSAASNPVIKGNKIIIVNNDNSPSPTDSTDFGTVGAGFGTSGSAGFTVINPGAAPLQVNKITFGGTHPDQFSQANASLPVLIAAGDSALFTLRFSPNSNGLKTATVTFETDNCFKYAYSLQGTGITLVSTSFNSSGIFTSPPGVTEVFVQAWGAGGNAAAANSANFFGGGGGAFVQSNKLQVSRLTPLTITIGTPGNASQASTRFGALLTANGGVGINGGAAGTGPNIAYSFKGGNGGMERQYGGNWYGGGGGGAGGTNGEGKNGQNAYTTPDNGSFSGNGGAAGTGGGNGGNGANQNNSGNNGSTPGGGGGGRGGAGSAGRIIVAYTCPDAGSIGNAHTITYPPQRVPDSVMNVAGMLPTADNGLIYTWQQSTNNSTWVPAKTPANSASYRFDKDSIKVNTYYRRGTNACNTTSYTNSVLIKVVDLTVAIPPDERIYGKVRGKVESRNGSPVKGITIYAQKESDLPGSPASWIDSTITGDGGDYTFSRLYYGDPLETANLKTKFIISPFKPDHGFNPSSQQRFIEFTNRDIENVNFTDTTVYAITGKIFQECIGCLNGSDLPATISGTVDSVEMYVDNSFNTRSGFLDPPGDYGQYGITVMDPGTYKIEPRYKVHKFEPSFSNVAVAGNVANVNFKDTTTCTISGRVTAGCDDFIGTAILEFFDILPKDAGGNARPSQFRKRVTTDAAGYYSIRLPARKYAARIIAFNTASDVSFPDLKDFFDVKVPLDSLTRDITIANATLNLVYNRPPTLLVEGLNPVCNLNTDSAFAIIPQSEDRSFTVKVYQGVYTKSCPAADTSLIINTNIQKDDTNEEILAKTTGGFAEITLTGGTPNIVAPHFKTLNVFYRDPFGRTAQWNRKVVVTGLKSNIGSFATVSPEVPLMVLHDPPGDNSFSFWETSKTNETATRFYTAKSKDKGIWAEVKLGFEFEAGLVVSKETSVWGTIKGAVNVSERQSQATESIITTTTTQNFSTASNDAVVGGQGDVFIGAALNLLYAVTNELAFDAGTCKLSLSKKLMVANNGFATQYIYSEDHIRNTLLPTLFTFRDNPANTSQQTKNYINQIKVWQQTLANNEYNKKRAAFDKNISFDGASGPITFSTSSSSSRSSTIDFDLTIDEQVAAELGFEFGGSGASAGVDIAFKMETGNSVTNTTLKSTTIGYTLDDDDNGDFYSVNVKKDPVYNTPVFDLVAGTTSCPPEAGSQPRDEMQLIVPEPIKSGIAADGEAEFVLKLSNTSQSGERRTYNLSFVQASNPNGAVVTIGGSQAIIPIAYSIDYLGEVNILVKVKRGASNVFSYEGLQFRVTDACDGSIEKTARISAFFTAACSPITLLQPENEWVNSLAEKNVLPVQFKDYSIAGTTSVALEYQKAGANNWTTGFTRTAAELTNSVEGTLVNWNVANLADGAYNLRMKLNCPTGVVNSQRASGIIDRTAPFVLGKPEPTDDNYLRGDQVSVEYNEALDCGGVTPSDVLIKRLSNGETIAANVGCYGNKIVVVPLTDISAFALDSFSVSVNNISDMYGNGKTIADTWKFIIGNTVIASGPKALTLNASAPAGGGIAGKALLASSASVFENGGIPVKFAFELPANAANDMLINFTISGNAVYQKDYVIDYSQSQNLSTRFDGAVGTLTMKKGTKKVELSIIPIPNQQFEPDKTVTITLAEGGDYELGANTTATGIILNDDTPKIYTFTGSGNYNAPANWDNNIVPPSQILIGDEVIINPPDGGECILNVPVTVMPGAKFTVMPGKVLKINSTLQVKKKL